MDESWQKLYDDLKDPNVPKEDKDKIWTFIQNESQRFMEFAYPRIIISDEDRKQIEEMKEKFLKLNVGSEDGYLKDLLGDPVHNAKILAGEYKKGEASIIAEEVMKKHFGKDPDAEDELDEEDENDNERLGATTKDAELRPVSDKA